MAISVSIRRHPVDRETVIAEAFYWYWTQSGRGEVKLAHQRWAAEPEGAKALLIDALERLLAELRG